MDDDKTVTVEERALWRTLTDAATLGSAPARTWWFCPGQGPGGRDPWPCEGAGVLGKEGERCPNCGREKVAVELGAGHVVPSVPPHVSWLEAEAKAPAPARSEPAIRVLLPGAPALAEVTIPPGGSLPREVHQDEDETIYVLAGSGVLYLPVDGTTLAAGDAERVPAGVEHQIRGVGTEALRLLVMLTSRASRSEAPATPAAGAACLCEGPELDPGPHLPSCRWSDPDYDPAGPAGPFGIAADKRAARGAGGVTLGDAVAGKEAEGLDAQGSAGPPVPEALRALLARGSLPCGHPVSALGPGAPCTECAAERNAHRREVEQLQERVERLRTLLSNAESDRMSAHFAACKDRDRAVTAEETLARWRERAAPLVHAIRAITVERPGGAPNGPAERLLTRLEEVLAFPSIDPREARAVAAALCAALANDDRRLRLAAEAFFGGDFGVPVPLDVGVSGPLPLPVDRGGL